MRDQVLPAPWNDVDLKSGRAPVEMRKGEVYSRTWDHFSERTRIIMPTQTQTITVIDNDFVSMWYYPDKGILHHQFHKYLWGDTFREALNKGVEVFEHHHASKWLSDDRKNAALSQADTEWAIEDWFPRVLKAGWKYWAIVLPENVIGQMNMKRFIANYSKQGVTARVFSDPVEAMQWLEQPA